MPTPTPTILTTKHTSSGLAWEPKQRFVYSGNLPDLGFILLVLSLGVRIAAQLGSLTGVHRRVMHCQSTALSPAGRSRHFDGLSGMPPVATLEG
jgi:hypothetical protein